MSMKIKGENLYSIDSISVNFLPSFCPCPNKMKPMSQVACPWHRPWENSEAVQRWFLKSFPSNIHSVVCSLIRFYSFVFQRMELSAAGTREICQRWLDPKMAARSLASWLLLAAGEVTWAIDALCHFPSAPTLPLRGYFWKSGLVHQPLKKSNY